MSFQKKFLLVVPALMISGMLSGATDYVVSGKAMPLAGPSIIHHYSQCDVGCLPADAQKNHCSLPDSPERLELE